MALMMLDPCKLVEGFKEIKNTILDSNGMTLNCLLNRLKNIAGKGCAIRK